MNKKDCKKGNRNNYTMNAYNMVDNNFPNMNRKKDYLYI